MKAGILQIIAICVLIGATVVSIPTRRVVGHDMAPSLLEGDFAWVVPGLTVRPGDVVALTDPLDPTQTILRRAIAGPGKSLKYDDGGSRIDNKRLRRSTMGDMGPYTVIEEKLWSRAPNEPTSWIIRQITSPAVYWEAEAVPVPDDHWYVLADDRDESLDSRWWGPVHQDAIQGVVRFWIGPAHTWRSLFTWSVGQPND